MVIDVIYKKRCSVMNVLNNKTMIVLLNLVEYPPIIANSAYGLVSKVSFNIAQDKCSDSVFVSTDKFSDFFFVQSLFVQRVLLM